MLPLLLEYMHWAAKWRSETRAILKRGFYMNQETSSKKSVNQVVLQPEVILDQTVFENVWLPVGDDKDTDVAHLLSQGGISKQYDSEE